MSLYDVDSTLPIVFVKVSLFLCVHSSRVSLLHVRKQEVSLYLPEFPKLVTCSLHTVPLLN